MKFALITFISFSQLVFSQQAFNQPASSTDSSTLVTKVVRVRYGIAQKISELVTGGIPVMVKGDNFLNVIVIKGPQNLVASVEQTIHELDVPAPVPTPDKPPKDIEVVVSIIAGSNKAELLQDGQSSEAITPVIKQLQTIFPYKTYQLVSSMLLHSRFGGKAENAGVMKSFTTLDNQPYPSGYYISYDEISYSPEEGKPLFYLRKFQFKTQVPIIQGKSTTGTSEVAVITDVRLQEGQKVVIGKANLDDRDLALFVVLTARRIE